VREHRARSPNGVNNVHHGRLASLEKMSEATRDATVRKAMGPYGTDAMRGAMAAFRDRLAERGEPFAAAFEYAYERLDVALTRLEHFFQHGPSEATPIELADVLVDYVFDRIAEPGRPGFGHSRRRGRCCGRPCRHGGLHEDVGLSDD